MSTTDFAPSAAHGAVAPASPSPDQIVLWGVNDDASCKCSLGHACPPKNRGKHPKCAPYEPGDNLGNFTGAEHGRIVIDVDVRTGDGFAISDILSTLGTEVNGEYLGETFAKARAALNKGDNRVVAGGVDSPYVFRIVVG